MSLPTQDPFTGTDGTANLGRTLSGGQTWLNASGTNTNQINGNRLYGGASGGIDYFDLGHADQIVGFTPKASGQFNIVICRANSGATTYLQTWDNDTQIRLFDEATSQIGSTITTTAGNGHALLVKPNGTNVEFFVDGSSVGTIGSVTHNQTETRVGFRNIGSEFYDDFYADQYAVAVPTATLDHATPTTLYITGTAGSGGTSPQWKSSATADGTFTNLSNGSGVSGVTTYSLTYGSSDIAAGTRPCFQVVDTSGTSNVCTGGKWGDPIAVAFFGDSITVGFGGTTDPVTEFAKAASCGGGKQRYVIAYNAGLSGFKASDWFESDVDGATGTCQSGSTSTTIKLASGASAVDGFYDRCRVTITAGTGSGQTKFLSDGYVGSTKIATIVGTWSTTPDATSVYLFSGETSDLDAKITASQGAGCIDAVVTNGVNNAYSAETVAKFGLDTAGICSVLLARGFNRVILNYPTGIPASEGAAYTKLLQLPAKVLALVNGSTILLGDTEAIQFFPDHTDKLQASPNQVHPNDAGYRLLGQMWGFAYSRAIGDVAGGGRVTRMLTGGGL